MFLLRREYRDGAERPEIVFLHAGRVAECTPVSDFFHRPASTEARLFLKGELPWT